MSLNTLRRWSDSGRLTCYRSPGGHRRYRRDDVRALLHLSENEGGRPPRRLPARHAPGSDRGDRRASLLTLAHVAAEGVGVPECRVSLVDANDAVSLLIARSRTRGDGGGPEDVEVTGEALPAVREVLRTGRRLVISDLGSTTLLDRSEADALRRRGDAAVLAVPVAVEGRIRAVLELVESRAQRAFSGANVAFAEFMARQTANLLVDAGGDREPATGLPDEALVDAAAATAALALTDEHDTAAMAQRLAQLDDPIAGFGTPSPAVEAESLIQSTLDAIRRRPGFDACTIYRVEDAVATPFPAGDAAGNPADGGGSWRLGDYPAAAQAVAGRAPVVVLADAARPLLSSAAMTRFVAGRGLAG
ncbi:MAG: GAF domain-containing protein, partial [Deltaproteobacteria bacterium]